MPDNLSRYLFIITFLALIISPVISSGQQTTFNENILASASYAGVRSSSYGINPFPSPEGWKVAINTMSGYYPGSTPCAIWIVGEIWGDRECHLFFPSDGGQYDNISFQPTDTHEQYLSYFDQAGIKVFLQVEPGDANVDDLIDLVLNRYASHSCVIGFGVDVEWYHEADYPGWGMPVNDSTAQHWEQLVKTHNGSYRLFLKHWDRNWMPTTYRGGLVFVDDSQGFSDLNAAVDEFVNYWAGYFQPNPVFFQIGYPADKLWWSTLENPARDFGTAIIEQLPSGQENGVFWADFTLRDVLPTSTTTVSAHRGKASIILLAGLLLGISLLVIRKRRTTTGK